MFLGFINTKISNKLLSLSNLLPLFYQPHPFWENVPTLPNFLENKQNSNSHFLCCVGEIEV